MSKTFDQGKEEIARLCEFFATNRAEFLAAGVKEAAIRQTLIDPLFESLGWDVRNAGMTAPQYREVVLEDSLDVEGQQKAPDYAFRVGSLPRFYVEAKKCGLNIGADPAPAYQLRRYGWSAKPPLSILTDFEEFAVYDCTVRPRPTDKASHARILCLRFEEYFDRWRELWDVFSREAVFSGKFDEFAKSKRKRGTSEVDVEFLAEIEGWRDVLARNFALRNKDISPDDLNAAVQTTIDRVVFLRMAEDRGLEPEGQLSKLCERPDIYARFMRDLCRRADAKYNSGLFHFQKEEGIAEPPDRITPKLEVDDKVLKPILESLYFEHGSPYHFGVMPVEILGTVYERFLGKVIRLTPGHQAKVEEKPEVRKAGGVYYTPAYIVDYIVNETVGKQIEGRSPAELAGGKATPTFRVLDMACGSGSFLLGAYRCLLDYCLKWYAGHKPEAFKKAVYPDPRSGQWRLTIEEKKRILTAHVFGVDIDHQAVEVSKLSLLLKVLEGENAESVGKQLQLFKERALPNLSENIKCGNSLVGPDYFLGTLAADAGEIHEVNPFSWEQGFPSAMKAGGFDCIIGNPPYVRGVTLKEIHPLFWEIYRSLFRAASAREWDVYLVFAEKGLALLNQRGKLGFILPNKFLNSQVGEKLRGIISEGQHLDQLVHFGAFQVFPEVTTYTCLLFLTREAAERAEVARYLGPLNGTGVPCPLPDQSPDAWTISKMSAAKLSPLPWEFASSGGRLLEKLKRWPRLESAAHIFQGTGSRADKVYLVEQRGRTARLIRVYSHERGAEYQLEQTFLKPALRGRSIGRYETGGPKLLLVVPYHVVAGKYALVPEATMAKVAPRTLAYLRECKPRLDEREKGRFKGEGWYGFGRPQNLDRFEVAEKIVMPDVANRGECFLDEEQRWLLDTAYGITTVAGVPIDLRLILAVLNSPLLTYFLKETGTALRGGYFRMKTAYLNPFPVPTGKLSDGGDTATQRRLIALVDSMIALHKQRADARSDAQSRAFNRQIAATDNEIDRVIYGLYELTQKEIAIVEGGHAAS